MGRSSRRHAKDHTMTATAQRSRSLGPAVDQTRNEHITAVNAGDVEASVNQFDPDGVFLPPGAPALTGAAIRGWFTQVFGMFRIQGFNIQPAAVEHLGNLAIEHGYHNSNRQRRYALAGATYARRL
jgi:ketosteroid isomerase-like protein